MAFVMGTCKNYMWVLDKVSTRHATKNISSLNSGEILAKPLASTTAEKGGSMMGTHKGVFVTLTKVGGKSINIEVLYAKDLRVNSPLIKALQEKGIEVF